MPWACTECGVSAGPSADRGIYVARLAQLRQFAIAGRSTVHRLSRYRSADDDVRVVGRDLPEMPFTQARSWPAIGPRPLYRSASGELS
jgi:hypothetical protein